MLLGLGYGVVGQNASQSVSLNFDQNAEAVGLNYSVGVSETNRRGQAIQRGGATYVIDYNNDNWSDVLLIGGDSPAIFKNTGGEFTRVSVFPEGIFEDQHILSALVFDYDNDGLDDVLLFPMRESPVFLENDGSKFVPKDVGIDMSDNNEVFSASAADYDQDGCLDLFIARNGNWSANSPVGRMNPNSKVTNDNGAENILFNGDCSQFRKVNASGITGDRWSLATSFVDLNSDGWPDIHVANDYNNDYLYLNNQNGTFTQRQLSAETNRNGMSSEADDFNNDGKLDLFITNIYFNMDNISRDLIRNTFDHYFGNRVNQGNNLIINRGDGNFSYRGSELGVNKGGWGWAAAGTDFDNDGDIDIFHTTKQFLRQYWDAPPSVKLPYPMFFEQERSGQFDRRNASQLGFKKSSGLGAAHLDFDRDGDQDLVVGQYLQSRILLYENMGEPDNWLQIDIGDLHRTSIGTTVRIEAGNSTQYRTLNARADYLSQDTRTLHFGLGPHSDVESVRITWPDGSQKTLDDISANQRLYITKNSTVAV
jgi:hypothetical protein